VSNSDKTCYLFTNSFPYGEDENFIARELPFLCQYFKQVSICNLNKSDENLKALPQNVIVKDWFNPSKNSNKNLIFKHWKLISQVFGLELKYHTKHSVKNWKNLLSDFLHQVRRAECLIDELKGQNPKQVVLYSYWMDRWATVLSIVKHYKPQMDFISRTHAFDLYEADNRNGYIKFRRFQLKHIKQVFAVSEHGEKYLKEKYPKYSNRISHAYLGVNNHDLINPIPKNKELIIVSCGSVQDRKRIKEIPAILSHIMVPFKWVHFGDGGEMDLLKNQIQKYHLTHQVELKGHVSNQVFLDYLKKEPISLFLSISRNEGLPYTMMEAISYGIPIFATDAMGCREICTDETGVLLPINFDSIQVATQIENFAQSEMNTEVFRSGIKNFWKENFQAEKNYIEFYKEIEKNHE
jgi:glycosyltransferase involved in cell wall biosynthesis